MKFIHFSDLHIGIERGPTNKQYMIPERVLDFIDVLDSMIEFAEEEDIDLAIFTGDAFHVSSPNQTYLNLFAKSIARLAKQCKVILLIGNHDMPGPIHKSTSLDIYESLNVENIIVGNEPKVHVIKTKNGKVQVATMPYPMKQWIAEDVDTPLNKINVIKEAENIIERLSNEVDEELPSILAAHMTVSSAKFSLKRSMVLEDVSINIESLIWPWDYVALGHIHMHQVLSDEPLIIYAGSLERTDFGDEGIAKGFILGNIEDGETTWEFIETDAREYVTLSIDLTDVEYGYMRIISKEITKRKLSLKDAVVRVLISVDNIGLINSIEIIDELEDVGVFYVQNVSIKSPEIITTPRLDLENPIQSYSPTDLLDIYFEEQDFDDDKIDDLLDLAEDIMKSVEMD